MLEYEIGITEEQLCGVFNSQEPNDVAFARTLELLVAGWCKGESDVHLRAAQWINDGDAMVPMRRVEPSDN